MTATTLALTHHVKTSTACLHHFVYRGNYETYVGEKLGCVAPDVHEEAQDAVAKLALDIIAEAFADDVFRSFGKNVAYPDDVTDHFSLTYNGMYHPHYYNFETDSINFTFHYSDALRDWMLDTAIETKEKFDKFLRDNYTSCDGFISFTPNNWSDWLENWNIDEFRAVSTLLVFFIEQSVDKEHYNYNFDEDASMLIEEKYISWEYATRFDNGYVAVVRNDDNQDECCDIVQAWLLDNSNNIINHVSLSDPYCSFNYSAYAAWDSIGYDLTKGYTLCGYANEQCEVPEDFDAILSR